MEREFNRYHTLLDEEEEDDDDDDDDDDDGDEHDDNGPLVNREWQKSTSRTTHMVIVSPSPSPITRHT